MPEIEYISRIICTAFLHSLWQAGLLAMVGFLITRWLGKAPAALRYNILCLLMILFFIIFLYSVFTALETVPIPAGNEIAGLPQVGDEIGHNKEELWASVINWINYYSFELLVVWLLVFLFRLLSTIRSIYQLSVIKTHKSTMLDSAWQQRVAELATSFKIKAGVLLKESRLVNQPLVIGIFKPVILFPVGLVNQLTPAETESILLHELAHIRRRDLLVNMIQHLIGSVFFFNPFLTWLSNQIKKEREFCCDELAIQRVDKKVFLGALLYYLQYRDNMKFNPHAIGYAGRHTLIMERVDRILAVHKNHSPGKILASFACIAGFIFLFSFNISLKETNSIIPSASKEKESTGISRKHRNLTDQFNWQMDLQQTIQTINKPSTSNCPEMIPFLHI